MEYEELFLGIDLGGTKIASAVVDRTGRVLSSYQVATEARQGVVGVLERLVLAARKVLEVAQIPWEAITAVGVGSPGAVDWERGVVSNPPNLPGWYQVPLATLLAEELKLPIKVENDANAAALGENNFGAGRDCKDLIYVTVSTGIGGGIIVDDHLVHGAFGAAGEIGHMVLNPAGPRCGCGNYGCLEALSSGTAIAKEARERIYNGEKSMISELAGNGIIRAEHVFLASQQGDRLAREVVDRAMEYLGIGVANLVNILNPEKVVIGGGVAGVGELLFEPVRQKVARLAFGQAREVVIMPSALGAQVGVIGAAAVAMSTD